MLRRHNELDCRDTAPLTLEQGGVERLNPVSSGDVLTLATELEFSLMTSVSLFGQQY